MNEKERFQNLLEEDTDNPEVQYQIGLCYLYGEGAELDEAEAEEWLKRAADQGHEEATKRLSAVREETKESKPTLLESVNQENINDWCRVADGKVAAGDTEGKARRAEIRYQVARFFELNQQRYDVSSEKVLQYYIAAAEDGHPMACLRCGQLLLEREKKPEEAFFFLSNAADAHIPEAVEKLAECYYYGIGTQRDLQRAEEKFVKSAEYGDGEAKMRLAFRYKEGNGVESDTVKARRWMKEAEDAGVADAYDRLYPEESYLKRLKEAAESGDTEAMKKLAEHLYYGRGMEKNEELAEKWLIRSAEEGDGEAKLCLAARYKEGNGVPASDIQARKWMRGAEAAGVTDAYDRLYPEESYMKRLKEAAGAGDAQAQYALACCFREGTGGEQCAEKAFALFRQAAGQDHPEACGELGRCYKEGFGTAKDTEQAVRWMERAVELENWNMVMELACCYMQGMGTQKNFVKAAGILTRAAARGSAEARCCLGTLYSKGEGVEQDYVKARGLYEAAAEMQYADAYYNLGLLYGQGAGVEQNWEKAVEYYAKAAALGHIHAKNNLGVCYIFGRGVKKDPKRGAEYFFDAAEMGLPEAMFNLGDCFAKGIGLTGDLQKARGWMRAATEQGYTKAEQTLRMLDAQTKRGGKTI